nr:hypothetical protein CFP56_39258 [Quercus suber]
MLEDIRLYLMSRFQQNRNSIMRVKSELCLKICKRLHRKKVGSERPLGRPKKKRILEPNEPRRGHYKSLGIAKRCKSCGKIGHNKRSCKGEVGGNSSLPSAQNQRRHRLMQTNGNGQRATQEQRNATSMPSS